MKVFCCIVWLGLLVLASRSEEHLYAHGPFGKAHLSVEKPDRINCDLSNKIFSRFLTSPSVIINELQVSTRSYLKSDKIHVSWTSSPSACRDDFIGVYFLETPKATGRISSDTRENRNILDAFRCV